MLLISNLLKWWSEGDRRPNKEVSSSTANLIYSSSSHLATCSAPTYLFDDADCTRLNSDTESD